MGCRFVGPCATVKNSDTLKYKLFLSSSYFDLERSSASNSLMASKDVKPSSYSLSTASSPILFSVAHCQTNCSGDNVVI